MQLIYTSMLILMCIDRYSATHLFNKILFERNIEMFLQQAKAMKNGTRDGPGFRTGTPGSRSKSSIFNQQFEPIRIKVEFHHESFFMSGEPRRLMRVVYEAVKFWENKLKVRRVNNPEGLKLSRESFNVTKLCNVIVTMEDVPIPTSVRNHHLRESDSKCPTNNNTSGFQDTDLILFVSYGLGKAWNQKRGKPGWCGKDQLAVASPVDLRNDEYEHRPVAGIVDICTSHVDEEELIQVVQHEIAHALGFTYEMFLFFRKKDDPWAFHDDKAKQLVQQITSELDQNGKTEEYERLMAAFREYLKRPQPPTFSIDGDKYYLATPKVKETAREFFACPTLNGAPMHVMDDHDGDRKDGSTFSHFDELTLTNDLMSAAISELTIPTPLTFSVFEDSGWYELTDDSDLDVDKFRNSPESANVAGLDAGCDSPDSSASLLTLATVMLVLCVTM